ncbi:HAMP domain-containing protein [Leptothoe spongobia TAU-MAC 1115]|uniref:histidine kinase n=2 Tax=Leptothoe TaxID=2651725 RepID=A0A947GHE0_9CYAN|nr:HAMP domain-containing protein [Leptothoe spongobia TAU-MAC 1115]
MKRSNQISFLKEARTKIFLLYMALMLAAVALSVPIFRALLFRAVDARVNENLLEEATEFDDVYNQWLASDDPSFETLSVAVDEYVTGELPEDDNFLIALLDGQVYRSNPIVLPDAIRPGSDLFAHWIQLDDDTQRKTNTGDPAVGRVIYMVDTLVVDGVTRGQFIIAHLSAGERQEALAGLYVFAEVAGGLLVVAFAVAWVLTGRLLQPVKELAKTARRINETDLESRIDVGGTGELAELANAFNNMMDRLQNAFNSQRNFINDAGHELRTPITIMQGHLELMGDDPAEQAETVDLVLDELDRMGRLVNDLILIVKAEHPSFLCLETVDVVAFCTDLFTKAQTLADRDWQLQVDTRAKIVADPHRLTGALLNLLQNAAQHTQMGDRIELGCRDDKDQVEFWVKDTGEGIPIAEQMRVFERFARVQHTQRKSGGSGLGLAIVRAIAEAHNGNIGLSSQSGIGSVFTLKLPIDQWVPLPAYQESDR